jgi:HD-like signal output (HDOD) protein
MEPGLSARIVSMANSALFSGQRPIVAVEDAIIRVGISRVRVMAATILLADQFDSSACPAFNANRYWFDAVQCAFATSRLAPLLLPREEADAAYLAGLLRNIGLLLLAHSFPKEMNRIFLLKARDSERSLPALEREHLGFDHDFASIALMREWQLPKPIIVVIEQAHKPHYSGDHAVLVQLINFSRTWAERQFELPLSEEISQLTFDAQRLEKIAQACIEEQTAIRGLAELLGN